MIVCKEFTFDAAHKLNNYDGDCANLHGHTYKLQICVKSQIKENGLAYDFKDISSTVKKKIIEVLDHTFINDVLQIQTSAENISMWIWKTLEKDMQLYEIKLWETPTSFVQYMGE